VTKNGERKGEADGRVLLVRTAIYLGSAHGASAMAGAGDSAWAKRHRAAAVGRAVSVQWRGTGTDDHQRLIYGTEKMGEREEKVQRGNHLGWSRDEGRVGHDGGGARSRTAAELYRRQNRAQGAWRQGSSSELEEQARAARVSGQR
jgi:hypothetical protein